VEVTVRLRLFTTGKILPLLLALLVPATAAAQITGLRPATPVVLTGVNSPHNTEGDLQQPTSGPYGISSSVTAAESLISQTVGGTDRSLTNNWEAFKFTVPEGVTRLGYVTVRFKTTGTVNAGSYVIGYLFSDSGGKPNTNISPDGTGTPALFFSSSLSGVAFVEAQFNLNADVVPGTSYWVAFADFTTGGGSYVLDTSNTGTALYATNNTDASGTVPSGGANWTTVNNVSPYFVWAGDTYISVFGFSSNYGGVQGRTLYGNWAVRGDAETGIGVYGKSRHSYGIGGSSLNSYGIRGSSVYGIGADFQSSGSFGLTAGGTVGGAQFTCSSPGCSIVQLAPLVASFPFQVFDGTNGFSLAFQMDQSGKVSAYASQALAGQGLPYVVGTTGLLSAQGANIGSTNLVASVAAGLYEVCSWIAVTRAATSSSTMPSVTIGWNNGVAQTFQMSATSTSNTTTTNGKACTPVRAAASTAITYSTAGFASSGATSMQYELYVTARAIF
jgi:hypothetical protein